MLRIFILDLQFHWLQVGELASFSFTGCVVDRGLCSLVRPCVTLSMNSANCPDSALSITAVVKHLVEAHRALDRQLRHLHKLCRRVQSPMVVSSIPQSLNLGIAYSYKALSESDTRVVESLSCKSHARVTRLLLGDSKRSIVDGPRNDL